LSFLLNFKQDSEDTSHYTSADSSDDEDRPAMLKPAFVPKAERKTLEEADGSAMAEQTTLQQAGQQDDRRRQTHELILQAKLQDVQVMNQGDQSDLDTSDDEESELAQYEAWKQRELQRIARDRCAHHILVTFAACNGNRLWRTLLCPVRSSSLKCQEKLLSML
jgi:microfibrillar-associated protein 1